MFITPVVSGLTSSLLTSTRAYRYSFQARIDVNNAVEMMPGKACGRITSTNACIRVAPSTRAADSRSSGIAAMNERNSHNAYGSANVV